MCVCERDGLGMDTMNVREAVCTACVRVCVYTMDSEWEGAAGDRVGEFYASILKREIICVCDLCV